MELKDTVQMMCSEDYRERYKAEYYQTKERYEKLKKFNAKIEASRYSIHDLPEPKHDCSSDLLSRQEHIMCEYLKVLEIRAVIENIVL